MSVSALPGFLTAVVASLVAAPALSGVQVVDGPPVESTTAREVVAVGISTVDVSVESNLTDAGLGSRRDGIDVPCMVRVWSGDAALPPLRDRAFALLAAVEAVLAADRTVGGTVTRARVMSLVYNPIRGPEGTAVELEFPIRVDAFRT